MVSDESERKKSDSTSITLLARARMKEEVAWERLVQLYAPLVYLRCRQQWQLAAEDAENVGQEVFSSVSKNLGSFDRQRNGSFRKWLRTIVDNKSRDHLRKKNPVKAEGGTEALQLLQNAPFEDGDLDDEGELKEKKILMHQATRLVENEVSPRDWKIFWRVTIDDANRQNVAEEFSVSDNVVYLACSRIRKQLKSTFQDLLDQDILGDDE